MKAFTIFMMLALANMVFSDFDGESQLRTGAVFKLSVNEDQRDLSADATTTAEPTAVPVSAPVTPCTPSDNNSANINDAGCQCATNSTINECEADKFCYENTCTDSARGTMGVNCPCLSFDDLPADVQTDISCRSADGNCISEHPDFPAKYGSACVAWENIGTWYDACHPTNPSDTPDYCANSWCYVDAIGCSEDNSQSSYFNTDNGFSQNVSYSYETCGHGNSWTTPVAASETVTCTSDFDCAAGTDLLFDPETIACTADTCTNDECCQ